MQAVSVGGLPLSSSLGCQRNNRRAAVSIREPSPKRVNMQIDRLLREIRDDQPSCALDVAAEGGVTLERVGKILGITRERVRQIERNALARMRVQGVILRKMYKEP